MSMLIIFHAGCADGFCAAWVLKRKYPDAEFLPAHYGDKPPVLDGKDALIVDFSYPRETLLEMEFHSDSLVVLDHHKTAQADLEGLKFAHFDMTKSGARLAWEWEFGKSNPAPWLVDYTEDRDLWRWKLESSKEINAALRSYAFDFAVWDDIYEKGKLAMVSEGEAILRYQQGIIEGAVKNAREVALDGYSVPSLNSTTLISEIAGELAKGKPFAVCWFERQDGAKVFSLRSTEDGIDVSEIAKRHGGGGHKHAAGFVVPPSLL